ncbi:hypothetical protein [Kribbella shirazensis]|uniref:DUF1345 domain-containing protein n=1 Tax=Kribbella shirazensis TaxID=1105143 RepID=A0A7X5VFY6_9ACTN|nr:hypothetical protein [Kribbella shirazensis]NIK60535.1 hypothetical protein [Kribbella shirazensis]
MAGLVGCSCCARAATAGADADQRAAALGDAGARPGWKGWLPGFTDYLFVSFTAATAFSPTDTMPLSARTKMLMGVQSAIALLTVAVIAARAVNVL